MLQCNALKARKQGVSRVLARKLLIMNLRGPLEWRDHDGAPNGSRNGNYRHGMATNDAKASRACVSSLIRAANELAGQL